MRNEEAVYDSDPDEPVSAGPAGGAHGPPGRTIGTPPPGNTVSSSSSGLTVTPAGPCVTGPDALDGAAGAGAAIMRRAG